MRIEKQAKPLEIVLAASFDENDGVLGIENRAKPPVSYGSELRIALTGQEVRRLGEALIAYAESKGA